MDLHITAIKIKSTIKPADILKFIYTFLPLSDHVVSEEWLCVVYFSLKL